MSFVKTLEKNSMMSRTDNGDITHGTTLNYNLDFFGSAASKRDQQDVVKSLAAKAIHEDDILAVKNFLFLRSIKTGYQERDSFVTSMLELAKVKPDYVVKLLPIIPEIGRWDDIIKIYAKTEVKVVKKAIKDLLEKQLTEDTKNLLAGQTVSILAKWMPTESSSNKLIKKLARELGFELYGSPVAYRKAISKLRSRIKLIETSLSKKDYSFDYNTIPGRAMAKYTKAFIRNDFKRYSDYLLDLNNPENKALLEKKTKTLFPYEMVVKCENDEFTNHLWDAQSKEETKNKILTVLDTSASMTVGLPRHSSATVLDAAIAIAIYSAERLTGDFKNSILTFSDKPKFLKIPDSSLKDKVRYLKEFSEVANTNIEKTYNLILDASKQVSPNDRPNMVLIVSDMEFDEGTTFKNDHQALATYEAIEKKYIEANIDMPKMIYWNMNVSGNIRFTTDKKHNLFISGFSSNLFDKIVNGEVTSAETFMKDALSEFDFVEELLKSDMISSIKK